MPTIGIGDNLMFTPSLKNLKDLIPDSHITYITINRGSYELLKGNPNIDELVFVDAVKKPIAFLKKLTNFRGKFDVSINIFPSNRASYTIPSLIVGAKTRCGHHYTHHDLLSMNFVYNCSVKEDPEIHNVEENLRLVEKLTGKPAKTYPMEIHLFDEDKEKAKKFWKDEISGKAMVVGIHPGTSRMKNQHRRRWSKDKVEKLTKMLVDSGFDVVVFGTEEEYEEVKSAVRGGAVWFKGNIREVAYAISKCDVFVSNDSGLMHTAAAVGVPVVAILGPTNEKWIYPWKVPHRIVVRSDLDCRPCFYYSPKPLKCRRKDFACMEIPAEKVFEEVINLIK